MATSTDDEKLEVKLKAKEQLDAADAFTIAAYEAGVWRRLRSGQNVAGAPLRRLRKRRCSWDGDDVEVGGRMVVMWRLLICDRVCVVGLVSGLGERHGGGD